MTEFTRKNQGCIRCGAHRGGGKNGSGKRGKETDRMGTEQVFCPTSPHRSPLCATRLQRGQCSRHPVSMFFTLENARRTCAARIPFSPPIRPLLESQGFSESRAEPGSNSPAPSRFGGISRNCPRQSLLRGPAPIPRAQFKAPRRPPPRSDRSRAIDATPLGSGR
jgi:hypothetical protein